jgi:WD40-like Beta Propeller Repeat
MRDKRSTRLFSVTRQTVVAAVAAAAGAVGCAPGQGVDYDTVYTISPPTWFEDGWSYYEVAADERLALFGARFGLRLIDLERGVEDSATLRGPLDKVISAQFLVPAGLVRLGERGSDTAWSVEYDGTTRPSAIPSDATPRWAPGSRDVAFTRPSESGVFVGAPSNPTRYDLGGPVTGFAWSPKGDAVFAIVFDESSGLSSLVRIDVEDRTLTPLRASLDATYRFNSVGVSPDAQFVYLALAGAEVPDPELRHRPDADRDMDIYELEVATGQLRPKIVGPDDDFFPVVAGAYLYWSHNEMRDAVVVMPAEGGEATIVVDDAQIPMWSHDGTQIGFTFGGWRIADWALNLDAAVVDVDRDGLPVSDPVPVVVGYHEDFTPAWSPDGKWMAYHSHRSKGPVAAYGAEGATDDIYLLRVGAPVAEEVRLTDFGWEVGNADWAPDGRRLIFDSWERGGTPGVASPWIATIDTATGRLIALDELALPDGFGGTLFGAWSPARDEIAIVEGNEGTQQAIWIVSVDGGSSRKVLDFESATYGGVDWMPDGETIVYSALAGERMQVFSVHRDGSGARQLSHDDASLIHPQVSPDGRLIAATRVRRMMELRRVSLNP